MRFLFDWANHRQQINPYLSTFQTLISMKVKTNLTQMVKTDYTPLQTTAEGKLTGGFGSINLRKEADASMTDINYCESNYGLCHIELNVSRCSRRAKLVDE